MNLVEIGSLTPLMILTVLLGIYPALILDIVNKSVFSMLTILNL
ncbi:MAG TPA: hypothetical protein PL110_13300 [Candidatus Eremiobacteraeota bacterium]|nr:hypothetical protein [Candidatus Eremiobacteraeota bacterium]